MLTKTLHKITRNQVQHVAARTMSTSDAPPKRVAVTGAAGNIAYSILYRIAAGEFLGKNQRIILHLVDLPFAAQKLQGVMAELHDCAFPLLDEVVCCTDNNSGFKDVDYAFMVGSKPRGPGMERADLLQANAKIFQAQG